MSRPAVGRLDGLYHLDPTEARAEQDLTHGIDRIGGGIETFDQVEAALYGMIHDLGLLEVINVKSVNETMEDIKDPLVEGAEFQEAAGLILDPLTQTASDLTGADRGDIKVAISVRAGLSFLPFVLKHFDGEEIGFLTQARNKEGYTQSFDGKLGSFVGKHAVLVDPMLATGGAMLDMVDSVLRHGAEKVTVVSAFTSPQGLLCVGMHPAVDKLITTPLEAGMDDHFYIVGAHKPHNMLGDFGDRYFGAEGITEEMLMQLLIQYMRKTSDIAKLERFNRIITAGGLTGQGLKLELPETDEGEPLVRSSTTRIVGR